MIKTSIIQYDILSDPVNTERGWGQADLIASYVHSNSYEHSNTYTNCKA